MDTVSSQSLSRLVVATIGEATGAYQATKVQQWWDETP